MVQAVAGAHEPKLQCSQPFPSLRDNHLVLQIEVLHFASSKSEVEYLVRG